MAAGSTLSGDFTVVGSRVHSGQQTGASSTAEHQTGVQEIAIKPRADGQPHLDDLFIFTSLKCNKTCHHCYVSSSPTNTTLDDLQVEDLEPLWQELQDIGTRNIYFSGGEPFLIRDFLPILEQAIQYAPVTIYTNASEPLEKKLDQLQEINAQHVQKHGRPILLRVSFDHYDPAIHNTYYGRGTEAYAQSLRVSKSAAEAGLAIAVTTQQDIHNNAPDSYVERAFRKIFDQEQISLSDVKVLPDIPAGQHADMSTALLESPISEAEFSMLGSPQKNLMCHTGRTLLKLQGQLQYFPCTLIVPDTPEAIVRLQEYALGTSLNESLQKKQALNHPACRAYCVHGKQSCAN